MPALTYVATGSIASNNTSASLSPGAPAGAAVGDLLLLFTGVFTGSGGETMTTPSGWTLIASTAQNVGLRVFARVADGTGTDTPAVDWSGSLDSFAWIECYSGDVYRGDLRGLVANIGREFVTQAAPAASICGVPKDNCLVVTFVVKKKTATSDDATTLTAPASGSLVKRTQLIMSGVAVVAGSATVQQTTKADYGGTDWTINGTADSGVQSTVTFAIRTEDGTYSMMVPDALSEIERTDTSSPMTISHPGAAEKVRGVVVAIAHGTSATDHISAVTYGGVSLTRKQRNTDSTTEPGASELWFLGIGVPQGSQTVNITCGATTDDIHAVIETICSDYDLEVIDVDGIDNNAANPSVTLQAAGREIFCYAALYSGLAGAATDVVPNSNCMELPDDDFGAFFSQPLRQGHSAVGDFAIGCTSATDDVAFSAMAISPILENPLGRIVNASLAAVQRAGSW